MWEEARSRKAALYFAFMLNRGVFFLSLHIYSKWSHIYEFIKAHIHPVSVKWNSEGLGVWLKVTELLSKDTRLRL